MKKTIKKITAALSAALMCALPMANAFTANAENADYYSGQKLTYRAYVNVNSYNKKVYELDYDLYFLNDIENDINFRKCKSMIYADSFFVSNPSQDRTSVSIGSAALNKFNGCAFTLTYDTDNWNIDVNDVMNNKKAYVYAFNNYAADGYIRAYEPDVTETFVLVGDADGNGYIKMNDAVIISQHQGEAVTRETLACDIDGDGLITENDVKLVSEFRADIIDSFADYQY